jgi:hypothetical protein
MGRILTYASPSHLGACQQKTQPVEGKSFDGDLFHGFFCMALIFKP